MSKKRFKPLSFNQHRLQKNKPVTFRLPNCDCVGHCFVPSHRKVETATISTNNPLTNECVVEMDEMFRYIPYCYLRTVENTHVHDEKAQVDEKAKETRQEHREEPKQKRTTTQIPDLDFSTLIPKIYVDVKFGYIPCVNGICQRGSIITLS